MNVIRDSEAVSPLSVSRELLHDRIRGAFVIGTR